MTTVRFSIVIPTRNRADTLRSCLHTCLTQQDYENYEIIVCDNCGTPETREVVEQAHSPRVKYARTSEPLVMSESWEVALAHATGEYVMMLGDDDGLMPYALQELDRIILQTQLKAISWVHGLYTWPNFPVAEEANYLTVNLSRGARIHDGKAAIAAALRFAMGVQNLPMIYHAAVHHSIIEEIRTRAGRVFLSFAPDSSAGISVAYVAGSYLFLEVPMTLPGMGPKSNNVACLRSHRELGANGEFWNPDVKGVRPLHPWVPNVAVAPVVLAESFLRSKESLFPNDDNLVLDRGLLAQLTLASLAETEQTVRQRAIEKIRESLIDVPEIVALFDRAAPNILPAPPPSYASPFRGFDGDSLHLSADRFGIRDIAGAVAFCASLMGYEGGRISYDLPRRSELSVALQQTQQQLVAAQARIQTLFSSSYCIQA